MGSKIIDGLIENQNEYKNAADAQDRKQVKEKVYKRYLAFLLMKGSDQAKYGSICKSLGSQFFLGNDQYPQDIQTATDILSNHKFDHAYYEKKKKEREKNNQKREENGNSSFAQASDKKTCYACGKDHTLYKCPVKDDIPRSQWHINKKKMNGHQKRQMLKKTPQVIVVRTPTP